MIHAIPAIQDRYSEILRTIMLAVESGGKSVQIVSDEDLRKANADERSAAQRALNWVWNTQIAKATANKPEWIHGYYKYNYLHPMYKAWGGKMLERAEFVDRVFDQVATYEVKIGVAFDMVRTRNLSIKRMAEYLTRMQQEAAKDGIILESNSDLEFKDLMVYAEREK